ncbi:zinc ribbon domain-containing protein [Bacillus mycoides]|uniref:zinc ribbon domain-containing protein n=1 Tax=Bacillus mycoides TaxID=1405 RepID=UPI00339BE6CD
MSKICRFIAIVLKFLHQNPTWYGKKIVKISRWFLSSQICFDCGHRDGKKSLEIRDWISPICHANHDRDFNASKNILAEGLRTLALV